jgi:hypothetical protein
MTRSTLDSRPSGFQKRKEADLGLESPSFISVFISGH